MQFQSLCGEDPLEGEVATHSSLLAWKIPWTEEPGGLQSVGLETGLSTWAGTLKDISDVDKQGLSGHAQPWSVCVFTKRWIFLQWKAHNGK